MCGCLVGDGNVGCPLTHGWHRHDGGVDCASAIDGGMGGRMASCRCRSPTLLKRLPGPGLGGRWFYLYFLGCRCQPPCRPAADKRAGGPAATCACCATHLATSTPSALVPALHFHVTCCCDIPFGHGQWWAAHLCRCCDSDWWGCVMSCLSRPVDGRVQM